MSCRVVPPNTRPVPLKSRAYRWFFSISCSLAKLKAEIIWSSRK